MPPTVCCLSVRYWDLAPSKEAADLSEMFPRSRAVFSGAMATHARVVKTVEHQTAWGSPSSCRRLRLAGGGLRRSRAGMGNGGRGGPSDE